MKTQNEKSFNCIAETKKGNFNVVIKVWEEIVEAGELFAGSFYNRSWKNEAYVTIEGEKLNVDEFYSDRIRSWEVGEKFGITGIATLRCDCSEVKYFMSEIEMGYIRKSAEADEEITMSKMIHNL
jgi:hypothetical protein